MASEGDTEALSLHHSNELSITYLTTPLVRLNAVTTSCRGRVTRPAAEVLWRDVNHTLDPMSRPASPSLGSDNRALATLIGPLKATIKEDSATRSYTCLSLFISVGPFQPAVGHVLSPSHHPHTHLGVKPGY